MLETVYCGVVQGVFSAYAYCVWKHVSARELLDCGEGARLCVGATWGGHIALVPGTLRQYVLRLFVFA